MGKRLLFIGFHKIYQILTNHQPRLSIESQKLSRLPPDFPGLIQALSLIPEVLQPPSSPLEAPLDDLVIFIQVQAKLKKWVSKLLLSLFLRPRTAQALVCPQLAHLTAP
jgi:hypothetical protein